MRYFIGFLVTIGLIVLLIVLLFSHGNGGKVPTTSAPLSSYAATDTLVRATVDEPINAPDNHRTTQITVGRDSTTFVMMKGYDGDTMTNQVYPMTQDAYAVFLHALQHSGYTEGNNDNTLKDERGYCPLGRRFIFEVIQDGRDIERYWATSCGSNVPSTFKGKTALILKLFRDQVPNYDDLTRGTNVTGFIF